MKTIICDLDGTLFDIAHRFHYIEGVKKDWDGFFAAAKDDTVNDWCASLLLAMSDRGYDIVFVSGRNESARAETERQIDRIGFNHDEKHLYMRPEKSRVNDDVFKFGIYNTHLADRDILFVLEDRARVARMWRARGLIVLQCDEGDF